MPAPRENQGQVLPGSEKGDRLDSIPANAPAPAPVRKPILPRRATYAVARPMSRIAAVRAGIERPPNRSRALQAPADLSVRTQPLTCVL